MRVLGVLKAHKYITLVVAVVLLIAVAFGVYSGLNYIEHDPNFCRMHHVMVEPYDLWATSVHRDVECHDCHKQSMIESAGGGIKWVLGADEITKKSHVPNELCEDCHTQIADTSSHKSHVKGMNMDCQYCHSSAVHRFESQEGDCVSCHTITPDSSPFRSQVTP